MRINKIEFQDASSQEQRSISFLPGCMNIVSAGNDFEKSSLLEAIQALIYGQRKDSNQNFFRNGEIRSGTIWLELNDRKIFLERDFSKQYLNIEVDKDSGNSKNFIAEEESEDIGMRLTGLSLPVFRSVMVMDQESAKADLFVSNSSMAQVLEQYTNETETTSNLDNAIACLQDKLDLYPFRGQQYRIQELITALNGSKNLLQEQLTKMDSERTNLSDKQHKLDELKNELEETAGSWAKEEYFQLCLEIAEIDSRILKVEERLRHEESLVSQLNTLGNLADFPFDSTRQVEELWAKRKARFFDLNRLKEEIKRTTNSDRESFRPEDEQLKVYTPDDAQSLYSLGRALEIAEKEYLENKDKREIEMRRVKDAGVDFDKIALVRKALLNIELLDLEDANGLFQQVREAKDELSKRVNISSLLEKQKKDLLEDLNRLAQRGKNVQITLAALTLLPPLILLLLAFSQRSLFLNDITIATTTIFVIFFVLTCAFPLILVSLKADYSKRLANTDKEIDEASQKESTAGHKLSELQGRADYLARKYNHNSNVELFKLIQEYSTAGAQLKSLDLYDHILASQQAQIAVLQQEIAFIFDKIGQDLKIANPAACKELANRIYRFYEHTHKAESDSLLDRRLAEIDFLEGELSDIHSLLRDRFYAAKLDNPQDIEQSYVDFQKKLHSYERSKGLSHELQQLKQDLAKDLLDADLKTMLEDMQNNRHKIWQRMKLLVHKHSAIGNTINSKADLKKISDERSHKTLANRISLLKDEVSTLANDLEQTSKNLEEHYPALQRELLHTETSLRNALHNKAALELAKKKLEQVRKESRANWSKRLTSISESLLSKSGFEIERMEWDEDLKVMVSLRGGDQSIHEADLSQALSRSMRYQVNWLAQMTLCRLLADKTAAPLLINDPFMELGDARFLAAMRLLIQTMLPYCQIIVFSSHQIRHRWLLEQLEEKERKQVNLIVPAG